MSRLISDPCWLLQVCLLVYQLQTDGLIECFNQTLKQMLWWVVADGGRDWDQLLWYVLFVAQETPPACTGCTPFELLFSWWPCGLLDVAKEVQRKQPSPFRSVVKHVHDIQDIKKIVFSTVREHLSRAQESQWQVYDWWAKQWEPWLRD